MKAMNERTKKVLWAIIQSYTELQTPVGSFMVKRRFSFGLSPATIRNTMAELEALGYVSQPHTSAGRIPTERGYRFYVDSLLKETGQSTNRELLHKLYKRICRIQNDLNTLIGETSKTLSLLSSCIGIVTPPRAEEKIIKYIRFIKYKNNRVLSILASEDGSVKNKMLNLGGTYSQRQLTSISNYLNDAFSGMSLREIREHIITQLSRERVTCDRLITNALTICKELIIWEHDNILMEGLSGTSNLPDFSDLGHIKGILRAIEDKHMILKLLNEVDDSKGVQVFLGLEKIVPSMKKLSMVVAPYRDKRNINGTIGIIGPTRMNYKQLIPIVDHTAKALTQVLSES